MVIVRIKIGRAEDNDVVIQDSRVSRYHCILTQYDDGRVVICDNHSTNGTFVNGQQIYGEVTLRRSDTVTIGNTTLPWTKYVRITPQNEAQTERISHNNYYEPHQNRSSGYHSPYPPSNAPTIKLRTHRSMLKYILLSLITLGIYGIVVMSHISSEINYIATKYDNRRTVHYCLVYFLLSWLTLGIYPLIWYSNLCSRMGGELVRRNLPYSFGAGHFWGWYFLGSLILIGPFVFYHKFFKAMNMLCEDYNARG